MKDKTSTPRKRAFERQLAGITIALASLALVVIAAGFGFGPFIFIDSFILVLGVAAGYALGAKDGENIIVRFGDGAVHAGYIGFLIGLVLSLYQVSEISQLGGPLALCFLTLLYSRIVKLICCHFE